ncbi:Ppx/GppA phosphatase family protein [Nafulsella turpanensis]|uniref:Ppx/GppA phosphatase family protein n=1 Tax=Nafulsella turpanensis TaxID=1265690 RepID=UPI0003480043|nr:hypothetical protein [Nafulsella turpanensis]
MKLAAIDIGSNAIRLQITNVTLFKGQTLFKRLEYVRFPLRLGQDVFSSGSLSPKSQQKFIKLMKAFKLLLELYEVDAFYACATSAMRNSDNGAELAAKVKKEVGLEIHIIDGEKEADMINLALSNFIPKGLCLHIDVGGGSTELNLYHNKEKVDVCSFNVGSVRILQGKDNPAVWAEMQQWINKRVLKYHEHVTALGTGGNINKIYSMAKKKPGKLMSLAKIKEIKALIESYDLEERIHTLQLNPDRADVIVPASDIYIKVMDWARTKSILVPDVGLKDGVMHYLYEKHRS